MLKKTPLSLGIGLVLWLECWAVALANEPVLLKRATPTTPVIPISQPIEQAHQTKNHTKDQARQTTKPALSPSSTTHFADGLVLDDVVTNGSSNDLSNDFFNDLPNALSNATPTHLTTNKQQTDTNFKTSIKTNTIQINSTNNPIPTGKKLIKQSQKQETGTSLASLSQFYQPNVAKQGRTCGGVWHYPHATNIDPNLIAVADYGYYNAKDQAQLSGNVIVNQNGRQIRAGQLSLNPNTGQAFATGRVTFGSHLDLPNSALMGVADSLHYNTQTGQMSAQDIAFASRDLSAHGYAGALSMPSPNSYLMEQTIFSTCPPNERVWHIRADQIHLDKETGRGIAKNTTLAIKNTPIFYLPYFNFPIDDRRSTGFLLPHIGVNSNDGLQVATPYYLNLAPNYDATITPTLYTNRNPKIGAQFRYLTHLGQGKIDGAYLPKDKQYDGKDRTHLFFEHAWQATDNLRLFSHYRYVSDSRYLSDFDQLGLENNALNLSRAIGASYQDAHLNAHLKAETYQKLAGADRFGTPITDKDRPYARLPELFVHYHIPKSALPSRLQNSDMTWLSHLAYFKKSIKDQSESEKSGIRTYNELSISREFSKPWGYFSPKAALTHLYTSYDEDSLIGQNLNKDQGSYSVLVPKLVLDAGLSLEKQGSPLPNLFGNKGGRQILSPRIKYLYSPYKDQSTMPNFETTTASPSYEQLLADSWFIGYDRISDLHAITPALAYRYLDKFGNTRLQLGIADQFYLDDIKVGLDKTINAKPSHSGIAWQASVQPYTNLYLKTTGALTDKNRLATITGSLHYTPTPDTLFNVGVVNRKADDRFGQLPLHAYTASAMLPIGNHWQLATATQYDTKTRQFMDTLIGLSYEDCCIGFSIYGRQYKNDLNPSDSDHRAIMAELRLTGLTGKGRLSKLLSEKVLGAEKVQW